MPGLFNKLNRKLLLISLDWTRPKDPPLSLGHASILTHLQRSKIPVVPASWSVCDKKFSVSSVVDFALQHASPNVDLGMGAFVWNEAATQRILTQLKQKKFPGRIILGGSQVSYTKKNLEKYYPAAGIFIRGYAEEALAQLMLSSEAYPTIPGVHFAGHPDLGISATADLNDLVSPYLTGTIQPQPFLRWETQRGCPFRCAFCQHRESDVSMKRRQFSESRVMQEVDFFAAHPIIRDIAVLDPVFNSGPNYLKILERFIQKNYTGKISLQCRFEMVKPEFMELVKKLNQQAHVVLEFGLQTIHRNEEKHIQRINNMKKVVSVLDETRQHRIDTEVSLIFGLPEQTLASFQKTVEFCKKMRVPTIYAYPLRLHRGTPLYDNREQLQLVESTDADVGKLLHLEEDHIGHVISSPSFTAEDWVAMAELAKSLDDYNVNQKMQNTLRHTMWKRARVSEDNDVATKIAPRL